MGKTILDPIVRGFQKYMFDPIAILPSFLGGGGGGGGGLNSGNL